MSANKRIAKNTLFLYIRMILVMVVGLYTTKIVFYVLGVEDYGIYNVVCGFVTLFAVFNTCLTTGTNRYYNYAIGKKDDEQEKDVFNASIRIQLIIVFLVLILLESFGSWYLLNKMVIPQDRIQTAFWIFQFSVFSLCLLILQIPYSSAVIAHEKMDFYAFISIIDVLLKLFFVCILQYVKSDKLFFYGILMTITSIVNFSLFFVYSKYKFPNLSFCRSYSKDIFKSLFSFSLWSLLDPITVSFRGQGSNLVLNYYFGPVVNAAYGISHQISGAIDGFTNNLSIAFRPQIIQTYSAGEYSRTKLLFFSMSRVNYMLHLMLIIPVSFSLSYILDMWLGVYPVETKVFTACIMVMQTINCLHAPISTLMVATGKIKKIKIVSALIICSGIPITIVAYILGFSVYSLYYILLVLTVLNVIASVVIMCQTFPYIRIQEYVKYIISPLFLYTIVVISIPFVIFLFVEESFVSTCFQCIITLILAVSSAYFIVLSKSEKQYLLQAFPNLLKKVK